MRARWIRHAVVALSVACSVWGEFTAEVDLRPTAWPPGDLEHYSALQNVNRRAHPPARGYQGMVVGSQQALAIRAGVEALRQGGTAVDAVLTAALAQITLSGGGPVSFAGKMSLVYYDAGSDEYYYLNGGWDVPRGQVSGDDIPGCDTHDGRQVLVHGFMAALEAAHAWFGELPFAALFGPSIYFAEQGFEVHPTLGWWFSDSQVITRYGCGREIFLKPDGTRYETGDWFRQPALAETLTRIAGEGASYLYRGEWAARLVDEVQRLGGRMTLTDLAAYEPTWLVPLRFEVGVYVVYAPRFPGIGGAHLEAAMTDLDVDAMVRDGHYTVAPQTLAALLTGVERAYGFRGAASPGVGSHSDSVVAVDNRGNVAALLHSINSMSWGGGGIFVGGVSIADPGCWAQYSISRAGPGGRMIAVENPVIVTRDGRPVAATSSIGSGLFPATLFRLVDLLVYDMDPHQAVAAPAFLNPEFTDQGLVHRATRGEFSHELLEAVRSQGYLIQELDRSQAGWQAGWMVVIAVDPLSGALAGATLNEFNGIAMAQDIPGSWRRPSGRRLPD